MRKRLVAGNWKMNTDLNDGFQAAQGNLTRGEGARAKRLRRPHLCTIYAFEDFS